MMLSFSIKRNTLTSRHVVCLPRKLDWIQVNCREKLRSIMVDNGTHATAPALGSNSNILTVIGDDRVYVERTIRAIMLLCCDFYVSCIQMGGGMPGAVPAPTSMGYPASYSPHMGLGTPPRSQSPANFDPHMMPGPHLMSPPPTVAAVTAAFMNPSQMSGLLSQMSQKNKAEVVFQRQYIEIYGLEAAVRTTYLQLMDMDFVKATIRDTKFQLELALEHKEFINGKKNGKINKIIKMSGCKITFQENFNGYNMLIDIYNPSPIKAMEGLALLQDELPAEISFFVPEAFHKRIIGVGGKNIQRIMKKYGVYVKFSNADEFSSLGGYFNNEDNVIARTPAKNAANLGQLKETIMELINAKDKADLKVRIPIPREKHRFTIGLGAANLKEIHMLTDITVVFPERETGLDEVTMMGPEPQVQQARHLLQERIPEVYDFEVPASQRCVDAIRNSEFIESVVTRLKVEYQVDLYVHVPISGEDLAPIGQQSDCTFMIYYYRTGVVSIDNARMLVMNYLAAKQHFNSKLLAPVTTETQPTLSSSSSYSLFDGIGRSAFSMPARGAKYTQSVPNMRLLFDDDPIFDPSADPLIATTGAGTLTTSPFGDARDPIVDRPARGPTRSRSTDVLLDDEHSFQHSIGLLGATLAATTIGITSQQSRFAERNTARTVTRSDSPVFAHTTIFGAQFESTITTTASSSLTSSPQDEHPPFQLPVTPPPHANSPQRQHHHAPTMPSAMNPASAYPSPNGPAHHRRQTSGGGGSPAISRSSSFGSIGSPANTGAAAASRVNTMTAATGIHHPFKIDTTHNILSDKDSSLAHAGGGSGSAGMGESVAMTTGPSAADMGNFNLPGASPISPGRGSSGSGMPTTTTQQQQQQPGVQYKVPNSKFCGLAYSRSMTGLDEKSKKIRVRPAPSKLRNPLEILPNGNAVNLQDAPSLNSSPSSNNQSHQESSSPAPQPAPPSQQHHPQQTPPALQYSQVLRGHQAAQKSQ
ncbi:hypothetical protein HK102_003473, partial [Quaeritorhiza haematococci]